MLHVNGATDTLTLSSSKLFPLQQLLRAIQLISSMEAKLVDPLAWTASGSTHDHHSNLTITTEIMKQLLGYIRSTDSLKGPCEH